MLHSLLDSSSLPVLLSMLPMDKVFSLSKDALMCEELVEEIGRRGFSRVPVTEGNRVIGVLHVSALLAGDRTRTVTLMQAGLTLQKPLFVQKDADLSAVLFTLLESKEEMAIIVDSSLSDQLEDLSSPPALGIITQTDLMALVLKVKKTPESTTPPSSSDMVSQDSLVIGKSRKGSYTAFDYEEMHSQDIRGTTDVERSGY
jgi:CBS domain containing-hemolysin-like protein